MHPRAPYENACGPTAPRPLRDRLAERASTGSACGHTGARASAPAWSDPGERISPVHFSDYDTRLAAYAALADDENWILLTWWNGEGHGAPGWSMPGGGVEYEESLAEAVEREVLEETGYAVNVGPPIAAHCSTVPDDGRDGRRTSQCELCSRLSSSAAALAPSRSMDQRTSPSGFRLTTSMGFRPRPNRRRRLCCDRSSLIPYW